MVIATLLDETMTTLLSFDPSWPPSILWDLTMSAFEVDFL